MLLAGAAPAQDYPNKPLRIVTSEAGGGNDVPARFVAQGLTLALGQQVMVENRPSGVVPGDIVSKAQPNGYTVVLQQRAVDRGRWIKHPYDAVGFRPVSVVARTVNVLSVPWRCR